MEPVLVSTLVVALAEIGDQTQLLAILLATRFRKPWPIIAGILVATIANHLLAATVGYLIADFLKGAWVRYLIAASFFATAAWALMPDKADEKAGEASHLGVFMTTVVSFFLVEMGDKTQIAAISLAARFHSIAPVAAGTTLGMMIANVPAVFLGERATRFAPLRLIRIGAALVFVALGAWTLLAAVRGWN
ncbi:MAG: TMEM165/GDT1 family protein [Caulobacteraceae bacterium]|nr:TMEM165/GDT1 family protein [Caulobacteraceae bacterium]